MLEKSYLKQHTFDKEEVTSVNNTTYLRGTPEEQTQADRSPTVATRQHIEEASPFHTRQGTAGKHPL